MKLIYRRCCGIDVHKATLSACVRVHGPGGKLVQENCTVRWQDRRSRNGIQQYDRSDQSCPSLTSTFFETGH
jgi:hypothetical protein